MHENEPHDSKNKFEDDDESYSFNCSDASDNKQIGSDQSEDECKCSDGSEEEQEQEGVDPENWKHTMPEIWKKLTTTTITPQTAMRKYKNNRKILRDDTKWKRNTLGIKKSVYSLQMLETRLKLDAEGITGDSSRSAFQTQILKEYHQMW